MALAARRFTMRPPIRLTFRVAAVLAPTVSLAIMVLANSSTQSSRFVAAADCFFWLGYVIAVLGDRMRDDTPAASRKILAECVTASGVTLMASCAGWGLLWLVIGLGGLV